MIARRMPGILPSLSFDEALECTSIHSVAGLVPPGSGLLTRRPFRAPHHTISDVALVGGGSIPRPGEISLAHHGVLFLDEMPEFARRVLEVLRQPLEEGRVTIARASRTVSFPARFMLIAAMNPARAGIEGILTMNAGVRRRRSAGIDCAFRARCWTGSTWWFRCRRFHCQSSAQPARAESSAHVRERVTRARERYDARRQSPPCTSDVNKNLEINLW